jgi:hypothetical protein
MSKGLIFKLAGEVSDDSLKIFGQLKIHLRTVSSESPHWLYFLADTADKVNMTIENGTFGTVYATKVDDTHVVLLVR